MLHLEKSAFSQNCFENFQGKKFLVRNSIHWELTASLAPTRFPSSFLSACYHSFSHSKLIIHKPTVIMSFTVTKPKPPRCPKKLIRKCFLAYYGKSKRVVCTCVPPCHYKGIKLETAKSYSKWIRIKNSYNAKIDRNSLMMLYWECIFNKWSSYHWYWERVPDFGTLV